jgi:hypothetical protein
MTAHAAAFRRPALMLTLLAGGLAAAARGGAEETERLYLSGRGPADAVRWDFQVSGGRRAGAWSSLPVPSHWELHGFGTYRYGMDDPGRDEEGRYRRSFVAPRRWAEKRTLLVFDGCMTDCAASLNGVALAPAHQGGFTRFHYDVTGLLRLGAPNTLEVHVRERSANRSVERAEREADYWIFGGIYRPVWIEATPLEAIERVRVAAGLDGRLRVEVDVALPPGEAARAAIDRNRAGADERGAAIDPARSGGSEAPRRPLVLRGEVVERRSRRLVDRFSTPVVGSTATIVRSVTRVRPWSAEDPFLYELILTLTAGASTRSGAAGAGAGRDPSAEGAADGHRRREVFGFRTFAVEPGRGLFLNGRRVLLKGVNRHSFWPTSGRALDDATNRRDVELLKALNANAVRTSHYPPDEAFLRACDELGLYVVDELPGWHDAYDGEVGPRIAREMVGRDHNHPSIVAWANGNEGGWSAAVDRELALLDLERRPVLHPDGSFGGVDAVHYPTFEELRARLDPRAWRHRLRGFFGAPRVVLPTEALHGLYDGGLGAGLDDHWTLIRESPLAGGLFLWSFADEGVVRGDRGGAVDTFANYGADGIVGPFRQKEGSFWAVRAIWSPVVLVENAVEVGDSGGAGTPLTLENRYDLIDLEGARIAWEWLALPGPGGRAERVVERGSTWTPAIRAGERGEITLPAVADVAAAARSAARGGDAARGAAATPPPDALRVRVLDRAGREVLGTVLPVRRTGAASSAASGGAAREVGPARGRAGGERVDGQERPLVLEAGDSAVEIDPRRGALLAIRRGARRIAFARGPVGVRDGEPGGTERRDEGGVGAAADLRDRAEERRREAEAPSSDAPRVVDVRRSRGDTAAGGSVLVRYEGPLEEARFTLQRDGWLRIEYALRVDAPAALAGVVFAADEIAVRGMRWLGEGPFRVWGNRRLGGRLGLWRNEAPIVPRGGGSRGEGALDAVDWRYPELAGFYAGVRWATLETTGGELTIALDDPARFLSVLDPRFPAGIAPDGRALTRHARVDTPGGDFGVLHVIPGIGNKFHSAEEVGPQGRVRLAPGRYEGRLALRIEAIE